MDSGVDGRLVPELIGLDDWGYPIVAPGEVPDELLLATPEG